MKKHDSRIRFGAETVLVQVDAVCRSCGAGKGRLHRPGCPDEECPGCAKAIIGCRCESLSPYEAEKIIHGLYAQFDNLEGALSSAGEKGLKGSSYLQHAAIRYIFNHIPESARKEIEEAFHLRFPELVPLLQDEEGQGYYTAEQLAEVLNIPLAEVNERIEAMIIAGQPIRTPEGKVLRKVH